MSILDQIAIKIIKEQEQVVGPIAWNEAGKVKGLHIIDKKTGALSIDESEGRSVVDRLINQYENLFGRASREVCKEAAASLVADMAPGEVPSSLQ